MAMSGRYRRMDATYRVPPSSRAVPFRRAEEAWFWAMAALAARRAGARRGAGDAVVRPCEPDDVVNCLDRLYRSDQISPMELRALVRWGERQMAPSRQHQTEQEDARLWRSALDRLECPLRLKGIVAPDPAAQQNLGKVSLTSGSPLVNVCPSPG